MIELADVAGHQRRRHAQARARALRDARHRGHRRSPGLRDGIERRLTDSIETALQLAEGIAQIEIVPRAPSEVTPTRPNRSADFSQHLSRPSDGKSFEELAPRNFSFNSPYGACTACDGLGTTFEVDPQLVVPNPRLQLADGAISPWASGAASTSIADRSRRRRAQDPMDVPWEKLTAKQTKLLLQGGAPSGCRSVQESLRAHPHLQGQVRRHPARTAARHTESESDSQREQIEGYMREVPCPTCNGDRLRPLSLAVTVDGHNIAEICSLSISDAAELLASLELSDRDTMIAEQVLKEINARVGFLLDVGLDYLSLGRSAGTLSGGEAQRIRLASQIGSGLVGVLYVLDEPSIGLHQRDNRG